MVVLSRGIFRRRASVLVAVVTSLSLLGGGLILAVQRLAWGNPGGEPSTVTWEVAPAPPAWSGQAGAAWTLGESLTTARPLFARELEVVAEGVIFPVAASAHDYFALRSARLNLDEPEGGRTRLIVRIAQRDQATWMRRSLVRGLGAPLAGAAVRLPGILPPLPRTAEEQKRFRELTGLDLHEGVWIEGGYVDRSGPRRPPTQDPSERRELFTSWSVEQPMAAAAATWYELRFDATHTYFCSPPLPSISGGPDGPRPVPPGGASVPGRSAGGEARLRLIDFGQKPEDSAPEGAVQGR
jgi:hypothetical protein